MLIKLNRCQSGPRACLFEGLGVESEARLGAIEDLPPNFFSKEFVFSLARAVGRPLHVDLPTQNGTRSNCAKVKVEVNLLFNLPQRIKIVEEEDESGHEESKWIKIRYDYMPKYCKSCKKQGQKEEECWVINPQLRPFDEQDNDKGKKKEIIGTTVASTKQPNVPTEGASGSSKECNSSGKSVEDDLANTQANATVNPRGTIGVFTTVEDVSVEISGDVQLDNVPTKVLKDTILQQCLGNGDQCEMVMKENKVDQHAMVPYVAEIQASGDQEQFQEEGDEEITTENVKAVARDADLSPRAEIRVEKRQESKARTKTILKLKEFYLEGQPHKSNDDQDTDLEHKKKGYIQRYRMRLNMETTYANINGKIWLFFDTVVECFRETGIVRSFVLFDEKIGGLPVHSHEYEDFAFCVNSYELFDQGYKGSPFTWWNGRPNAECIFKRLDRIFVNMQFQSMLPTIEVEHLIRTGSDHAPLLMTCGEQTSNFIKPFRFLNFWTEHATFMEVVRQNWEVVFIGDPFLMFKNKLKKVKIALSKWSKDTFGDIFKQFDMLEEIVKAKEKLSKEEPTIENTIVLQKPQTELKKYFEYRRAILEAKSWNDIVCGG
uniref:Uncharacterized protein n=1 Tax=Nicotiana tabacum TaxID=4097 RepID=A0A1S4BVV0_TOBAC|nr:PREDICTED: uncharacterized protein LOC107812412 [Nicotiana tabacum]